VPRSIRQGNSASTVIAIDKENANVRRRIFARGGDNVRPSVRFSAAILSSVILLTACTQQSSGQSAGPSVDQSKVLPATASRKKARSNSGSAIGHIVIIIQENRTPDNLFQGLPGANIATGGMNLKGQQVVLHAATLEEPYDISHSHPTFLREYDGGKMDGFNNVGSGCGRKAVCAYGYVPSSETQPYFAMATQYAFADNMFSTNEGPSYPAHQYLISGTSVTDDPRYSASENPSIPGGGNGSGCDAPARAFVETIDQFGNEGNPVFPCFDRPTLGDLLDAQAATWRYYQMVRGPGVWHAYNSIRHIRFGNDYANVVAPSQQILTDIANGQLANVSWVTPAGINSDHSGTGGDGGPAWVASIVNAMGESQYWNDCAIFVVWDDWGGWYDHVPPPVLTSYELGFRVPLIVISPYAKMGFVSHTQYEFGSILKFVEEQFSLPSLGTTDARSNSPDDMFNFAKQRRSFRLIRAKPFSIKRNVPDND
jgi:phospholipase C